MWAPAQVSRRVSPPEAARVSAPEPARASMSVPVLVPKAMLTQAVTRRPRVLVVAGPSPTVRERPLPARRVRGWECGDVSSQAGERSTAAPRRLEPAAAEQRRARRTSAWPRVRRRPPSAVRSRPQCRQLVPVRAVRRGDRSRTEPASRTAAAGRWRQPAVAASAAQARPGFRGRSASRSAVGRLRAPVDSGDNVAWFVADGVGRRGRGWGNARAASGGARTLNADAGLEIRRWVSAERRSAQRDHRSVTRCRCSSAAGRSGAEGELLPMARTAQDRTRQTRALTPGAPVS